MIAYRGKAGMWAWVLNRITGLAVVLFLYVHVADTFLIGFGPDVYNEVMGLYRAPVVRFLEVGLVAAVLYHGLNGIRVMLINFWEPATRIERQLFYGVVALTLIILVPTAIIMIGRLFV